MHLKTCALALTALTFSIPALSQTPTPAAKPKSSTAAKPAAAAYDRALLRPATLTAKAPETYQVQFDTTRGTFTVTVTRAWSPLGADRFYNLVKHHYFDNARFFRVLPGFVAQFGLSAHPSVNAASLDSQGFTPFGVVDGNGMNIVEMLYDQYGESAGMDQENITTGGEKYIAAHWPKLDTIKSATLIGAATTAPTKPAASAKPAPKPATSSSPKPQQ